MAAGTMNVIIEGFDNVVDELQDMHNRSKKVVQRTVADFKSRGPSWISQEVAKEYGIKKADINEAKVGIRGRSSVRVHGTRIDDLSIIYRGRALTPTHFGMKPNIRPSKGPYVVTALIKKSSGRESLGSKVFLGTPKNAKAETPQLPFQREGDARYPLKVIKTVSVPQMITNETVSENIHKRINTELGKRLEHHLKRLSR
ncbi:MAG: hypothetical protein K2I96_03620 [Lachnospiraceae bacterium]|nr:hypothetical protein [Lachnospiraceae bacterium]